MNSSRESEEIAALVLAAGRSRRMGSPKLLLPWGRDTVIGKVVRTLQEASLEHILVITGGAAPQVQAALAGLNVRLLHNPSFADNEMLATCQIGLAALDDRVQAALIVLGDQPQIEVGVVKSIHRLYEQNKPALIVPSYQMHRGHPWLVTRRLWSAVLALRPEDTLRVFLAQQSAQITYLPVETASVLQDLDTPEDYDRYKRSA